MDNIINFPSSYKKALLNKTKDITIRTDKEIGKYKTGFIYECYSYKNTCFGVKIKIVSVNRISVDKLSNYKIPDKSIKSFLNKTKINCDEIVELIRFDYIS